MGRRRAVALAMGLRIVLGPATPLLAAPPPAAFLQILQEMHPDYSAFVHAVRRGGVRLHPHGILAGVVRPGGEDPRDPEDAPRAGAGERNDIIVYEDTFSPDSGPAWQRLIVDHEYFHTRHFGHGIEAPTVDFGEVEVNQHYYEALAWRYNLERIEQGSYPGLSPLEQHMAGERFHRHRAAFERWVRRVQESAWEHYGPFLAGITSEAPTPPSLPPGHPAGPDSAP